MNIEYFFTFETFYCIGLFLLVIISEANAVAENALLSHLKMKEFY